MTTGIHRGGFRPYAGEFEPLRTRFLVVFSNEFRRLLTGRWTRIFLLLAAIPLIVTLAVMVGKGVVESKVGSLPFDLDLLGHMLQVEMLFVALLGASAGGGILANDRSSRALVLYLSRPLTPARYLLGKGLALGALLGLAYLVPAWLFVVGAGLMAPVFAPLTLLGDLAVTTLAAGFNVLAVTLMVMVLSAMGKRARWVGLAWFGLFFFSQMISRGAREATGTQWPRLFSLPELFADAFRWALAPGAEEALPAVVLAALVGACVATLRYVVVRRQRREGVGA